MLRMTVSPSRPYFIEIESLLEGFAASTVYSWMNPSSLRIWAMPTFIREAGMVTRFLRMRFALRRRVNMSLIGSVIMIGLVSLVPYQAALRIPGISPRWAALRRQIRQIPNFLYTARCRPHIVQRVYARVLNLGFRACLTIQHVLAMASCPSLRFALRFALHVVRPWPGLPWWRRACRAPS